MLKVLLVCTGNTCRSAIAEGLLRQTLASRAESGSPSPVTVSSAGTAALDGLPASPEAIEVCREVGADIRRHRSRRLTPALLADSDLVLVMEEHHRQAALKLHPGVAGSVFLLSEYARMGEDSIPDPVGGGGALYRRTRGEIERRLEAALPLLLARAAGRDGAGGMARIEIGADHRGFELKQTLIRWLGERGHAVTDRGCDSAVSCDYPEYAFAVARGVAAAPNTLGVLICGSGVGMSIAANKVHGVRAALCLTPEMARLSRRHNDANVLVLGADLVAPEENRCILEAWLGASFEGGRHARRVDQMMAADAPASPDRGGRPMDDDCIFCRIVAGEIPAVKLYEDDRVLIFRDIKPAAPTHALVIPKAHIATFNDLSEENDALVGRLFRAAAQVARQEGLSAGYRLVGNCQRAAGQEVFHIHLHLLGGRGFGWPPG